MTCNADNFLDYNEKSVQLYNTIHEYSKAGYSKRAISKMLYCSKNTVTKYLEGDYDSLCRKNFYSGMDQFYDYMNKIIERFHIDIVLYRSSSADAVQEKASEI